MCSSRMLIFILECPLTLQPCGRGFVRHFIVNTVTVGLTRQSRSGRVPSARKGTWHFGQSWEQSSVRSILYLARRPCPFLSFHQSFLSPHSFSPLMHTSSRSRLPRASETSVMSKPLITNLLTPNWLLVGCWSAPSLVAGHTDSPWGRVRF